METYRTNHAEHFLTRVDRLDHRQAELALGLYRDAALVEFLLKKAKLPGDAERVAISLDAGDRGPYVIVTRKGEFVTCLGEGMRLHADQPVVSHHSLHRLGSQIDALREILEDAKSGKSRRSDELIQRVLEAGHVVTQGDFDELIAWSPLMGRLYVQGLLQALELLWTSLLRLRTLKRVDQRAERLLQAHWKALWASLHFTMLVGDQSDHLTQWFERLDIQETMRGRARTSLILSLWKTGLLSWGLRGAWLAARLPKAFIKPLKEAYSQTQEPEELRAYGAALVAIGHRHKRYRKEITQFVQRAESTDDQAMRELRAFMGNLHAKTYIPGAREELLQVPIHEANLLIEDLDREVDDPELSQLLAGLSDQAKVSMMLSLPLSLVGNKDDFGRSFFYLPSVAQMEARDFYLPDAARPVLLTRTYHPNLAKKYLDPGLQANPQVKPAPTRAARSPGRNEPCPCGSGKKYKRCCALSA